jgi:hypothetical protein
MPNESYHTERHETKPRLAADASARELIRWMQEHPPGPGWKRSFDIFDLVAWARMTGYEDPRPGFTEGRRPGP